MSLSFTQQERLDKLLKTVHQAFWFSYEDKSDFINTIIEKYGDMLNAKKGNKQKIINKITKEICDCLKLNFSYVTLNFVNYSPYYSGSVGEFFANSKIGCEIRIMLADGMKAETYICTILHELTHYFIYVNDIVFDIDDEEVLTDISAVYLGFGKIMQEGYKPFLVDGESVYRSKIFKIGYLEKEEIDYIMGII